MKSFLSVSIALNVGLVGVLLLRNMPVAEGDRPCEFGDGTVASENGDVNGDGLVDMCDVMLLLDWIKGRGPAPVPCVNSPLPDTGQTTCYDSAGNVISCDSADWPGQDGFYEADCPSDERFVDNGDGTILDICTGLMWQKESVGPSGAGLPWKQALEFCENLVLAGHDDWRLPNILELATIIDFDRGNRFDPSDNAISPVFAGQIGTTWSSTTYNGDPRFAWYVHFPDGDVDFEVDKDLGRHVRAVRGPTP